MEGTEERTCKVVEEVAGTLDRSCFEHVLRPSVDEVCVESVSDFVSKGPDLFKISGLECT